MKHYFITKMNQCNICCLLCPLRDDCCKPPHISFYHQHKDLVWVVTSITYQMSPEHIPGVYEELQVLCWHSELSFMGFAQHLLNSLHISIISARFAWTLSLAQNTMFLQTGYTNNKCSLAKANQFQNAYEKHTGL